jgi:hypothetical protein
MTGFAKPMRNSDERFDRVEQLATRKRRPDSPLHESYLVAGRQGFAHEAGLGRGSAASK